jgi:hypothetical protein
VETKQKTWMPTTAGILNIIVGSLRLLVFLGVIIAIIVLSTTSYWLNQIESQVYPLTIQSIVGILTFVAVFIAVLGMLSLLGGISALQRKRWGLALAGSIASMFGPILLGIPAIIFTALSKDEFN